MPLRGRESRVGVGYDLELFRLRVNPADVVGREIQQIEIVFLIGRDAVCGDVASRAGDRKRAQVLVRARLKIEPQDGMIVLIIGPDLPVHMRVDRHHHRFLGVILLQFLREREHLDLFRLSVEFRDAALIHHGKPEVFILVEMQFERAGGEARVSARGWDIRSPGRFSDRAFRETASAKSEYQAIPAESTTTSCGSAIFRGKSYSVMMTRVARPLGRGSVLNGYSHVSLELKLTLASHSAEPPALGASSPAGLALHAADQRLWMRRGATRRVKCHALENLHEFIRAVSGPHDAFESVAIGAIRGEISFAYRCQARFRATPHWSTGRRDFWLGGA